jgi:hypothetical protein
MLVSLFHTYLICNPPRIAERLNHLKNNIHCDQIVPYHGSFIGYGYKKMCVEKEGLQDPHF